MEIKLIREPSNDTFTYGKLFINEEAFCDTLEDIQRFGDGADCSLKVSEKTAIPKGRYEVIINFSNRFQKYMPLLLEVPCYTGIRVHNGSYPEHSAGCILVGFARIENGIGLSKKAFAAFMARLKAVEKKEKIFCTIT